MAYGFAAGILLYGVLYLLSKDRYNELMVSVDKKIYPLKDFMPGFLYLMDKLKYKFNTAYDNRLQVKFGELYGYKNARYHLEIHWANKAALILLMGLIILLIGANMDAIDSAFLFFSVVTLVLTFYLADKEVDKRLRRRRLMLQLDFPDFLNKLVLLINAGMTISRAMERIVLDRQNNEEENTPLYSELHTLLLEIKAGKSEIKAYESFARRCRQPEITKFVSVIIQNLRKGNAELVPILRLQAVECWESRKNTARVLGEEASTKLLFPMMMMFLAILIIVITPSIMQL